MPTREILASRCIAYCRFLMWDAPYIQHQPEPDTCRGARAQRIHLMTCELSNRRLGEKRNILSYTRSVSTE